jgi:hypothetical protein
MDKKLVKRILKNNGDSFLPNLTDKVKEEILRVIERIYDGTDKEFNQIEIARDQGYLKGLKFLLSTFDEIIEGQKKAYDDFDD